MRKLRVLFAAVVLMFTACSAPPSTNGQASSDIVLSLQIDNPKMEINGAKKSIDGDKGTKPVIINGRTLVPIRAIIETFGGDVLWNDSEKSVSLTMNEDKIKLKINSNKAYLNNTLHSLDSAPQIIGGRTMLPIRFIAEGFNLGVAWDDDTKTVYIIRDSFTDDEYQRLKREVPEYFGNPYVKINNNKPYFKDYEIIPASFEYYSELDDLKRCDVCISSISEDIMPTEKRGNISSVKPSGWHSVKYSSGYLYNRCHLIGFQLTGENANERNLITGTRTLNVEGMLPFENMVDDYIERTGNHVMYRSTPVFTGNNLVADGVLMEAYSVEDNGYGISFCVYCYNVEPYIKIDYLTGESFEINDSNSVVIENTADENSESTQAIYRTPTGKRYHYDRACSGKNSYEVTLNEALESGLTPCKKCAS